MRRLLPLLIASLVTAAADAPLTNTGAPMRAGFVCSADLGCTDDEPCKVYLELSGIESNAGRVFLSGNVHTSNTTLASILLVTEDGGRTWSEAYPRMPFTTLDAIQFVDFEHGWISGENVQTVARDPFLLVTEDGGRAWRPQPVFEDEQPGAIQRFWFESAKEGMLLLDRGAGNRYELYRTRTGAATWELERAAHEPIGFPGARGKESTAGWRFRPDAPTSSWLIEQNRDGAWQRVAAFFTEIATCR